MKLDPVLVFVMVTASTFVLGGLTTWITRRSRARRALELSEAAAALGFESLPVFPGELDGIVGASPLMMQGRRRSSTNIFRRHVEPLDVILFDYRYTVGHGKSSQVRHQTVALFRGPRLRGPRFVIRPEGWRTRLGEWFGGKDIDFPDAPEFSDNFVLAGDAEEQIRLFFTEERLQAVTPLTGVNIEAQPGSLIVWYDRRLIVPSEVSRFFQQAFAVYSSFCSADAPDLWAAFTQKGP